MQLADIDLNLIGTLNTLLKVRNVSDAARRVGLSQPAMSHALARLRSLFGDELLLRSSGKLMILTSRAQVLQQPLQEIISAIHSLFEERSEFDPASCDRTFHLAANDYVQFVLLPPTLAAMSQVAPHARIRIRPTTARERVGALATGEIELGLGLIPENAGQGIRHRLLFRDELVLVHRAPSEWGEHIEPEHCAGRSFVVASPQGDPGNVVDECLKRHGVERERIVEVPHFAVAAYLTSQSDYLAFVPGRLARMLAPTFGLHISSAAALRLNTLHICAYWHARTDGDPACRWLRQFLTTQVAPLATTSSTSSSADPSFYSAENTAPVASAP